MGHSDFGGEMGYCNNEREKLKTKAKTNTRIKRQVHLPEDPKDFHG